MDTTLKIYCEVLDPDDLHFRSRVLLVWNECVTHLSSLFFLVVKVNVL